MATISDREFAVEVDTALAALWQVESRLTQPLEWAKEAVFRAAGMVPNGTKFSRFERAKVLFHGSFAQALQAVAVLAEQAPVERPWEAREAKQALARYEQAQTAMDECRAAQEPFNEVYREARWTRAFLVLNSNGHVHSSRSCSTCFVTTPFGWLPEVSGMTEAEIVDLAGESACTVCYPSAPVASLSQPRRVFHQSEKEAQAAREAKAAAKAAKEAAKAAKALEVNLRDLGGDRIQTVAAAKAWLTDCQQWNGWTAAEGRRHPSFTVEMEARVAQALATKNGTTPEAEIEAAKKRASKRR